MRATLLDRDPKRFAFGKQVLLTKETIQRIWSDTISKRAIQNIACACLTLLLCE
jgi:hypothetical protein